MDSRAPLVDLEDGQSTAKVVSHRRPYKQILMEKRPIAPMQDEAKIDEALKRCPAIIAEDEDDSSISAAAASLKSKAASAPEATMAAAGSAKEQQQQQRPPLERRVAIDYSTRDAANRISLPESPVDEEITLARCTIGDDEEEAANDDEDLTSRLMSVAERSTKHEPREHCPFKSHSPQSDSARPTKNVAEQPAAETKAEESGADKSLLNELSPGDMQVIASMVVPASLIAAAYETPGQRRPFPLEEDDSDVFEDQQPKAESPPPRARSTSPTPRQTASSPFAHQSIDRPSPRGTHELIGRDGHVHLIEERVPPLVRRRTPSMEADQAADQLSRSNGGVRGMLSRAANRVRDILYTGSFSGARSPSPLPAEDDERDVAAPSPVARSPKINHQHETQKLLLSGAALP